MEGRDRGKLKEDLWAAPPSICDLKERKLLLPLLRLIFDQTFRHGWSLAGCWLEFLAARIVVRNKKVFNFV